MPLILGDLIPRLGIYCSFDERPDTPELGTGTEAKLTEVFRRLDAIEAQVFRPERTRASPPPAAQLPHTSNLEMSGVQNWQLNPALLQPSYIPMIVQMNLMQLVEESSISMQEVTEKYFQTIHNWMPMIAKECFLGALENPPFPDPHSKITILLYAFYLVTSSPADDVTSAEQSRLYLIVKYQFSLQLSLGEPSIELIQAGVLIALYEHIQNIPHKAYVTIGNCVKLANLYGFHNSSLSRFAGATVLIEEKVRTWRAIVMVNR